MTLPQRLEHRITVVELRRLAPQYLDVQGQIASTMLKDFGTFTTEPAPIRLFERIIAEDHAAGVRAAVNGESVHYQRTNTADLLTIERDARVYFRRVERLVSPDAYDRVGVLFSFSASPSLELDSWLREAYGVSRLADWTFEEAHLQMRRPAEDWNQIVTVRRWGIDDVSGVPPRTIRVDVDQFRLNVSPQDAWQVHLEPLFADAEACLKQLVEGVEIDGAQES